MQPTEWEVSAIVPAAAGWELLDPTLELNDPRPGFPHEFYRQPVVAWLVETCRRADGELATHVTPVTVEGYSNTHLIRRPDGRVFEPETAEWDNEELALEGLRERWRIERGEA